MRTYSIKDTGVKVLLVIALVVCTTAVALAIQKLPKVTPKPAVAANVGVAANTACNTYTVQAFKNIVEGVPCTNFIRLSPQFVSFMKDGKLYVFSGDYTVIQQ